MFTFLVSPVFFYFKTLLKKFKTGNFDICNLHIFFLNNNWERKLPSSGGKFNIENKKMHCWALKIIEHWSETRKLNYSSAPLLLRNYLIQNHHRNFYFFEIFRWESFSYATILIIFFYCAHNHHHREMIQHFHVCGIATDMYEQYHESNTAFMRKTDEWEIFFVVRLQRRVREWKMKTKGKWCR